MRLQRDSYAPKSCAFDAANVQFLRAHLCKSHPVLQHGRNSRNEVAKKEGGNESKINFGCVRFLTHFCIRSIRYMTPQKAMS